MGINATLTVWLEIIGSLVALLTGVQQCIRLIKKISQDILPQDRTSTLREKVDSIRKMLGSHSPVDQSLTRRKLMKGLVFVVLLFGTSATLATWAYEDVKKPVVAVAPFQNGSGRTVVVELSVTLPNGEIKKIKVDQLGRTAATRTRQMLAAPDGSAGKVTLVDQGKFDIALAQAELGRSGIFSRETVVGIGTQLLAETLVLGNITKISIDDRTTRIAGKDVRVKTVVVELSVDIFKPATLATQTSKMFKGEAKDFETSTSSGLESEEELMRKALAKALDSLQESQWLLKTLTKG